MTTYYVDSRNGADSRNGLGPESAWKSLDEVNDHDFKPGDKILFRAGMVFEGRLDLSSAGTASNPITFGSYGTGANPVIAGDSSKVATVKIDNADHVRLENLEIVGGGQGVMVERSDGVRLIGLEVHGARGNGIHLSGSDQALIQGGSSYANGSKNGHGVLMSNGAANNTVQDMDLYRNVEDGVQFSPDAGNGNVLMNNVMRSNREDGVDSKNGSQKIVGNHMHDNARNAVMIHENSRGDTITLVGNRLEAKGAHALDVSAGANVVSSDNVYAAEEVRAVRLQASAGKASFDGDRIIDEGRYTGNWMPVDNGSTGRPSPGLEEPSRSPAQPQPQPRPVEPEGPDQVDWTLPGTAGLQRHAGSPGDDRLVGTPAGDVMHGGKGADVIEGRSGDDLLFGGRQGDRLYGGDGDDHLAGGKGPDLLDGGAGDDLLIGGSGNDRLDGGAGDDALRGGSGADALRGAEGADVLLGDEGNDDLHGGPGSDVLRGGAGDDRLFGGEGRDVLFGDKGNDQLAGGGGADRFVFGKGFGSDRIVDFEPREDSIDLRAWNGLDADKLMAGAVHSDGDVSLRFGDGSRLTIENVRLADIAGSLRFGDVQATSNQDHRLDDLHDLHVDVAHDGGTDSLTA